MKFVAIANYSKFCKNGVEKFTERRNRAFAKVLVGMKIGVVVPFLHRRPDFAMPSIDELNKELYDMQFNGGSGLWIRVAIHIGVTKFCSS